MKQNQRQVPQEPHVRMTYAFSNNYPKILLAGYPLYLETFRIQLAMLKDGQRFTIGRDRRCDFQMQPDVISRLHCYIVKNGNDFVLCDVSKNGTVVVPEEKKQPSVLQRFFTALGC